jgi:hypothetical protein
MGGMKVIGINDLTEEEYKDLQHQFKDTQLPDPEIYPRSFDYCVRVWRTTKELNNGSVS